MTSRRVGFAALLLTSLAIAGAPGCWYASCMARDDTVERVFDRCNADRPRAWIRIHVFRVNPT